MELKERLTQCLEEAVARQEAAGMSLLIWRKEEELAYAQAGMANIAEGKPIRRDSIFRLYSMSKPITAAAAMILIERGVLDEQEGVDRYLPGFRNPRVIHPDGSITPALRAPWIGELLAMTSGLCYPDADPAGQAAAAVFEKDQEGIRAGGGMSTLEFCNALGQQPLAFLPGTHWRYGTSADVLGAVIEAASGKRFGDFLREEIFEPLGMKDTGFWVPPEKRERLVTTYERMEGGLKEFHQLHLAVGAYDRPPAFESGGAGLVSTADDYMAFARMLMNGGAFGGRRILSGAAVRHMTGAQLSPALRRDLWDSFSGFGYGHFLRICDQPGALPFFGEAGEYGWDGWLGTSFFNLPESGTSFLFFENVRDSGTTGTARRCRSLLAAN